MSLTCFEPRGFILRKTDVYAVFYVLHTLVWGVWPHRCMYNVQYCIHNCFPEDEATIFETCKRHKKLKLNIRL